MGKERSNAVGDYKCHERAKDTAQSIHNQTYHIYPAHPSWGFKSISCGNILRLNEQQSLN